MPKKYLQRQGHRFLTRFRSLMRRSRSTIAVVFVSSGLAACDEQPYDAQIDFAITHINVITMESSEILNDQTILIGGGKIQALGPSPAIQVPEGATLIDGRNKYALPGLAEMHAHIPVPRDTNDTTQLEETLFLYLSNGITTIRGMLGHPYHLKLREQAKSGAILSPRIYTAGPSLNGRTVPNDSVARAMVREQKQSGYDFLKLHPGLSLRAFNAIVETAREVGMPFAGHVSVAVGVRRALAAKYASIDHLDGYIEGLVPENAGVDPGEGGFFGYNFTALADTSRITELVQLTKANGVWLVPTQSLFEHFVLPEPPGELAKRPEMRYIAPRRLRQWIESKQQFLQSDNYSPTLARRYIAIRRRLISAMQKAGVGLLLGSDAPQIFNVAGFSIQDELRMLVASGLSPYEALLTGTVNPARFFNAEDEFGTIAVGKAADLVLVNRNPLNDVTHMANPAGVMVRGRWLPRSEIQSRLDAIATRYQRIAVRSFGKFPVQSLR